MITGKRVTKLVNIRKTQGFCQINCLVKINIPSAYQHNDPRIIREKVVDISLT